MGREGRQVLSGGSSSVISRYGTREASANLMSKEDDPSLFSGKYMDEMLAEKALIAAHQIEHLGIERIQYITQKELAGATLIKKETKPNLEREKIISSSYHKMGDMSGKPTNERIRADLNELDEEIRKLQTVDDKKKARLAALTKMDKLASNKDSNNNRAKLPRSKFTN
ncbi:hypothetical protein Ciccas_008071 [Cichlidogyrus casuarinus]|uniref:Uncharacterized protein n=1 Tax=Cichlidogyrus casuarinus TaxID=1844966 RepID=A0ABD2Q289_9PLAT